MSDQEDDEKIEEYIARMRLHLYITDQRMTRSCGDGIYENRYNSRNSRKLMASRTYHLRALDRLLCNYRATQLTGCFRRVGFPGGLTMLDDWWIR